MGKSNDLYEYARLNISDPLGGSAVATRDETSKNLFLLMSH